MSAFFSDAGAARTGKSSAGAAVMCCSTTAAMVLLVLVPAIGLSIDVGMMYLRASAPLGTSDAAALAGARSLARGSDDSTQRSNAESTANTYFYSNFPAGYFASTNLQVSNVAATDSTYMRSITTTASVDLPFIFMRSLSLDHVTLHASAKSTRRDVNVMIVMDRSTSLTNSGSCTPLKAAAVNFVEKFAESRDNMGTGHVRHQLTRRCPSDHDVQEFGGRNAEQRGVQRRHQLRAGLVAKLPGTGRTGADGRAQRNPLLYRRAPDRCHRELPGDRQLQQSQPATRRAHARIQQQRRATSILGLYKQDATAQPMASDQTPIATPSGCSSPTYQDVSNAPLIDYWGNSLNATAYRTVQTSGTGLNVTQPQNVENFSTNAADDAALRIRRGDPDALNGNRTLPGVTIFSIGLGNVDDVLLKRMANDPSLAPNPVAAGNLGRYVYAANATDLDQAFTRVASELLRLAR